MTDYLDFRSKVVTSLPSLEISVNPRRGRFALRKERLDVHGAIPGVEIQCPQRWGTGHEEQNVSRAEGYHRRLDEMDRVVALGEVDPDHRRLEVLLTTPAEDQVEAIAGQRPGGAVRTQKEETLGDVMPEGLVNRTEVFLHRSFSSRTIQQAILRP